MGFAHAPSPAIVDPRLSDFAFRLLAQLMDGLWSESVRNYVTVPELARRLCRSESTVKRGLRVLERAGYIRHERDRSRSGHPWVIVFCFRLRGSKIDPSRPVKLGPSRVQICTPEGSDLGGSDGSNLTPPSNRENFEQTEKKTTRETRAESSSSLAARDEESLQALVELVMAWLWVPREKASSLLASLALLGYPVEWVRLAIEEARRRNKRDWGFLLGILRNWEREGGPTARPSWKSPQPPVSSPAKQPPPPPPVPLTAADVAELVAMAASRGPDGRLARIALRDAVRMGEVPAEVVPAELLLPEKAPTAGSSAKIPPRPAGVPSPGPACALDQANTPEWIRTTNLRFRSPIVLQPSEAAD